MVDTTREAQELLLRRVATASMAGTVLEWYDFFLFSFTAALVFGKLFFPTYSPLAGTLASFGTLAVGFVARPLGGILFGHFGDRIGRKTALIMTTSIMGGSSFVIGLIPSYDTIGVAAPTLLVILRFIQGIGLGGEWGGAILMTLEYSPQSRRGFFGSVVQVGTGLGLTLATASLFIGSILPGDAFFVWGWRIPFLVSIVLLIVGLYIRLNLEETPAFRKVRETGQVVRVPIAEVLRVWPKQVLATTALYLGGVTVPFYTVSVFLVYYSTSIVHIDRSAVLLGVVVNNTILLGATIMGGVLADKIGHRFVFLIGVLLMAVLAFPVFWLTDLGTPTWLWVAMLMFGTPFWFTWGVVPAYFYDFFPAQVRYTGISVGSQSATIIGGLVPFFATALLPVAGTWPVALLVIITSLISSFAVVLTAKIGYAPPETLTLNRP
jgi:MFS transporter, MHS family, shikimate and dehydroshikimate transport protein